MTLRLLTAALLATAAATAAQAADPKTDAAAAAAKSAPKYLIIDRSSEALMDKAAAQAEWAKQIEAKGGKRLAKLYPVGKFGFISQVEGGFTADKTCVVAARAMLVPRAGKVLQFAPEKIATTFDAKAGADAAACKALGAAKLAEAVDSVLSTLVK
ncbi:hypothetical protein [Aquabacterium sp. OR-4]|uniref:hypothetical protein n=1 Tax=Aquabacterium sp. OR-4 TaxID=2978127 RepID=UPI0021B371E1|nr:hypothetical protein [Aquabacterium sp. OR-4]MDT7833688.1 hypothetical protein [Aquabacterium sp. OR-4]